MLLGKLVTGGQTGVEAGVMRAAKALGFPYAGRQQKQKSSVRKDEFRAAWNAAHADATLIVPHVRKTDLGSAATLTDRECLVGKWCERNGRPCHIEMSNDAAATYRWLKEKVLPVIEKGRSGIVLNVVGPLEEEAQGIQQKTERFVRRLLKIDMACGPYSRR